MFDKILIANRGEIACRIMRTARRMGIKTVAVYSTADSEALHVRTADEAVCIGPPASAESYLRIDTICDAALSSGAQAIHPGYGFLSENAAFAQSLIDHGIRFIGPGPDAIRAMGDKITSKRLAKRAGVDTIPGHADVLADVREAVRVAAEVGYPVMLKASAGGGGKGMRVVRAEAECAEAFERAAGEARSSFGDDRMFLEKFIEQPRHIEIQVLADAHGNIVHLGERECSMQRRHQKVIEEAPSPFIDQAVRQAMGAQAAALARAVDYQSAGTVEFVVDAQRRFYFLEMNTRLQVEHPVTELVTGIDLVECMIRIAAGEPLSFAQADIKFRGWAVEARIYAEDPTRGFLPSTGRLVRFRPPNVAEGVRIDTGVDEGSDVSMHYDPMIAKLVTHEETREAAAAALIGALNRFTIQGVAHNTNFLAALVSHPRFANGQFTTSFIDEHFPDGFTPEVIDAEQRNRFVALAVCAHIRREARLDDQHLAVTSAARTSLIAIAGGIHLPVAARADEGGVVVDLDGQLFDVRAAWHNGDPLLAATLNGESVCVQIERIALGFRLAGYGHALDCRILAPRTAELYATMPVKQPPDMSRFLLSPMPGLLVQLLVEPGQEVQIGQELAVVEAMKMENTLRAVTANTVLALLAVPGDNLAVDQPIIEFVS